MIIITRDACLHAKICSSRPGAAAFGGEISSLLRRNSLFWRCRERGAAAGKRRSQDFGEDFSFCLAPGAWRCGWKETIAGFWRRFLLLPGAGSVALRPEREDCRILKKNSPFLCCRIGGFQAERRKFQKCVGKVTKMCYSTCQFNIHESIQKVSACSRRWRILNILPFRQTFPCRL